MREKLLRKIIFFGFGLSGMAALIYEVVWTRSLSTVMGSSTYALSTMLAAFMAGLSVGGWLGARLSTRIKNMAVAFALCELGIGLMGMVTIPVIKAIIPLYIATFYAFHESFSSFSIVQFIIVFMIMGVPTTLMGLTFPVVIKLFTSRSEDAGRRSGHLYCINTFGAVLGSVLAGFLLIPAIGARGASFLAASLNILTATVILFMSRDFKKLFAATAGIFVFISFSAALSKPHVPFFSYYSANRFESYDFAKRIYDYIEHSSENLVVFHYEGVESDVYLTKTRFNPGEPYTYTLINGGKREAGDEKGFSLLADLPFLTHPPTEKPMKALNIGLGSGRTLANLAWFPLEHIDSVELSKGIIEANRRFLSPELFKDPRINHIQADGRNFLFLTPHKYDIMVVSPSWAVELSSAGLLTDEFFSLAASRLHSTGTFAIWLDYFVMEDDDLETILRTFRKSFSHATMWQVDDSSIILVGSNTSRLNPDSAVLEAAISLRPELKGHFKAVFPNEKIWKLPGGPINTDDRPLVEFHNAMHIITGKKRHL